MKKILCVKDKKYGTAALIVDERDFELVCAYVKRFYDDAKSGMGEHDHPFNWLVSVGTWLNVNVEFSDGSQLFESSL